MKRKPQRNDSQTCTTTNCFGSEPVDGGTDSGPSVVESVVHEHGGLSLVFRVSVPQIQSPYPTGRRHGDGTRARRRAKNRKAQN